MWPLLVVMLAQNLNDDIGLGSKPPQVQELVSELAIETLIHSVLPGFAGINQSGGDAIRE